MTTVNYRTGPKWGSRLQVQLPELLLMIIYNDVNSICTGVTVDHTVLGPTVKYMGRFWLLLAQN